LCEGFAEQKIIFGISSRPNTISSRPNTMKLCMLLKLKNGIRNKKLGRYQIFIYIFFIYIFYFLCSGCFTVAQLQSPKVLDEGEIEIGGGTTLIYSENSLSVYELLANLRIGIGRNTDVGFRVFGMIERFGKIGGDWEGWKGWGGIYADIKHQFTEKLPYVSGVLGVSYSIFNITLYPSLIVGTDRFYASFGPSVIAGFGFDEGFKVGFGLARLSIGYSFGGKIRLTPEVGTVIPLSDEEGRISGFFSAFGISFRQ